MRKLGTLAGKVAAITGAGSGIGHACAELFAQQGARLMLAGRREAPLQELTRSLGATLASRMTVDVTRAEDNEKLLEAVVHRFGRCDILVASAGAEGVSRTIEEYP